MEYALEGVAEKLAVEFPQTPSNTVIRVVTDCVAEFPEGGPLFIEHAARARLDGVGRPE